MTLVWMRGGDYIIGAIIGADDLQNLFMEELMLSKPVIEQEIGLLLIEVERVTE